MKFSGLLPVALDRLARIPAGNLAGSLGAERSEQQ